MVGSFSRSPGSRRTGRSPSYVGDHLQANSSSVPVHAVTGESSTLHPTASSEHPGGASCHALGALLFPSVPLWTFVTGAVVALPRAGSLAGLPSVVIKELSPPVHSTQAVIPPAFSPRDTSDSVDISVARSRPVSTLPSLNELLEAEEHEISVQRRRARCKRAADSASKKRRSSRLAAKEDPIYTDATAKATRIKAARLDLTKASEGMKAALGESGILQRPPPPKTSSVKLRRLGHVCGLPHLSEVEDEDGPAI